MYGMIRIDLRVFFFFWIFRLQDHLELPLPVLHLLRGAGEPGGRFDQAPHQGHQMVRRSDPLLIAFLGPVRPLLSSLLSHL